MNQSQTQIEVPKSRMSPLDFFLQLGIFATLYASAFSIAHLLFQTIDAAFPDKLAYYDFYSTSLRFAIASLIIFFPTYLILGFIYMRQINAQPEKRNLGIRKWLVYLTLFAAGLTMLIDLIVLLNNFLGGEISARFVLKVVAVILIAGIVFAYYLIDVRRRGGQNRKMYITCAVFASVIVLGSIILGFAVIGSPFTQREKKFDQTRISDLQNIQGQIVYYWQQKRKLPNSLSNLSDSIIGYTVPVDPKTDEKYAYEIVSPLAFKICATFAFPSDKRAGPYSYSPMIGNETWNHESGKACFERQIDPDMYPRVIKPASVD